MHGAAGASRGLLRRHILRAAGTTRNRERERGSWPVIRLGPKSALMSLDDRAADRQPDPHTAGFGRVKGFEQPLKALRSDTATSILHAQTHATVFFSLASNEQFAGAVLNTIHRVTSIAE